MAAIAIQRSLSRNAIRKIPNLSSCATSPWQLNGQHQHVKTTNRPSISIAQQQRSFTATAATAEAPPPIIWTTDKLTKEQILKVDKIFHKILWLDLFEAGMLTELMNEKLGLVMTKKQRRQLEARITAMEEAGSSAEREGSEQKEEEEAKPALVDVKLVSFDAKSKIKVIKEVRGALELGLKDAKALVEGAPVTLQKAMQPEAAAALKAKLEAAGAQLELTDV